VFRERVVARSGEVFMLSPNLDAVHLFDGKTGARMN
jgi:hypothetical protein